MLSPEDFTRRLAVIEARERELDKREKAAQAKGLRHNLYERVTVSVRTLDAVIVVCALLILILVIAGVMQGRSKTKLTSGTPGEAGFADPFVVIAAKEKMKEWLSQG